jgi:ubiquinol-cytochrome c reductase iron-sulfur subunit
VLYVVLPDTQLLGLTLGGSLALFAAAMIVAGKALVPQEKAEEERPQLVFPEKEGDIEAIVRESADGISRRKLLAGAAGAAGATVGAAAIVPVASLGPRVGDKIHETPWQQGRRIVDDRGEPIKADEIEEGAFHTGFPEGASKSNFAASVVIVKLPPNEIRLPRGRAGSAPDGIIAFSKICTHAGCAVSIYRHPLYEPTSSRPALVCPCHYSTFDVRRGGAVEFGPAPRDLPQLPLAINQAGELVAQGDFFDTIGPSYAGSRLKQ